MITLLAIASLNGNGYVREKAVNKLSVSISEKAIVFIVYRLADWVQNVRQAAQRGLENFKRKQFINALVDNLFLFEWLQKVERINLNSIYEDIMKYVIEDNKHYIVENFKTFNDRTRLIIATHFINSKKTETDDLKILITDSHFLIRSLALKQFERLSEEEINNLLNDKSAAIRLKTLYCLQKTKEFYEIIYPFLFDPGASVRELARYTLKDKIKDFAMLYNEKLLANKNIIGSLSGLAETNGTQYTDTIEKFLSDKSIKIKKVAFVALRRLDAKKCYDFALRNLNSEYPGIRNLMIDFLSVAPTSETLSTAREIYRTEQYELKKSMLKLFSKVGKWATIGDIMLGTIDENENIRNLSLGYLKQWRIKATTYFTKAKPAELDRANEIFKFAFDIHEKKKYFKLNPLSGIDFYIR